MTLSPLNGLSPDTRHGPRKVSLLTPFMCGKGPPFLVVLKALWGDAMSGIVKALVAS